MKTDPNYGPSKVYQTYPFPILVDGFNFTKLEEIGNVYHNKRSKQMLGLKMGLTKVYNFFHSSDLKKDISVPISTNTNKKIIENTFGKEVWNMLNHLQNIDITYSFEEALTGILELRELHVNMDNAVLEAYGWQDIDLKHDFYEVDYLPENDRIRFTIHPDARKEIIIRLLELNHKIHEEEMKAGLWDKKSGNKRTTKSKTKANQVNDGEAGYGGLFDNKKY